MTSNEKGGKWGWIGGGLGGLCWIPILAAVLAAKGQPLDAAVGAGFFVLGCAGLYVLAPWRRPHTSMGFLYLGMVLILLAAAAWMVIRWDDPQIAHFRRQPLALLPLLPIFTPVFLLWRKTWAGLHHPPPSTAAADDAAEETGAESP